MTPDSLRYLLRDLFSANTFWELQTERAVAERTGAGDWRVSIEVRTRKYVVDPAGVETEVRVAMLMGETHYVKGWHTTGTVGTFGAAGMVGRKFVERIAADPGCLGGEVDRLTLVDVIGAIGYFSMLQICLNSAEVDLEPGTKSPFADLPGYRKI